MERDHLEGLGIDGNIIVNWIFKKGMGALTGLIWSRIETCGGLFLIFRSHKIRGIS
jgi:hypothetical protein